MDISVALTVIVAEMLLVVATVGEFFGSLPYGHGIKGDSVVDSLSGGFAKMVLSNAHNDAVEARSIADWGRSMGMGWLSDGLE